MPKIREGEEEVGFRPHGHTDLFTKSRNFNYDLQRKINEQRKVKFVKILFLASLVPIIYFLRNAQETFRKAQVKEISAKRRERLG